MALEFGITWNRYYSSAFQFWAAMISLVLVLILISYLMIRSLTKIWFRQHVKSRKSSRSKRKAKPLHPAVKAFVTAYLVLNWIAVALLLLTRVYLYMLTGNLFCWVPDYPLIFYITGRIFLGYTYLTRYSYNFIKSHNCSYYINYNII